MVIDFSKVDIHEQPLLILKNISGTPLGTLGAASNVVADIKYNEVSALDFNLPAYTDGVEVPNYNNVVGMKIIDLQDMGQFILMNPKETGDGIKRTKTCKAYSLEYEFTFKKITLQSGTYNFWNPVSPDDTILGIILDLMPSWSVGSVDSSLIGKYRTYEVSEENLYNFMKNTLQQSYSCIFDFDTYNRVVNVKDVSSTVPTNPFYISLDNLAKEITVEEDTESIVTRVDVNGADGVDIRAVNPTGNNKIINLDYYMTTDNFAQSTIDKYYSWKERYKSYQLPYYNLSIEYSLQIMRKTTETAALTESEGELTSLENQQAVIIRAIAQNLDDQSSLNTINAQISAKQSEINAKKAEIEDIQEDVDAVMAELVAINEMTNFQNSFTEEEYIAIDRFIKDDSISESSFVVQATSSYSDDDFGNKLTSKTLSITNATVTSTTTDSGKTIYEVQGGSLKITGVVTSNVIRSVFEKASDGTFVMTAYLGKGSIDDTSFETACLSLSGSCGTVASTTSSLSIKRINAYLYLTLNTSEYAKRAVAWDLYEYGSEVLEKISQPSFKFSVSSANFLFIEEFEQFKNSIKQGEKLYVGLSEEQTLAPIAIGLKINYDSPQNLSLEFSDTYVSGDSSFMLADLLEQSVSMGKNVDTSKFTYSAFVDSGANTQVKEFMTSALDVAKNAIMSSKDQAISWGDSGIRLRKWTDETHKNYDPQQIWMNNNSILMTSNNWSTAEIAIGNFYDKNLGDLWGVVAPNIVGTLLAGNNLVIESSKKDGSIAVFRVDADGCYLHNSELSVTSDATKTHILLDAEHGIALGTYPLIDSSGKINENNYKFWVDETGNLFFKGTLKATNGEFTGKVTATSGYIGGSSGWTIESTYIYNGKPSYSSGNSGVYIGTDGIALGNSTNYVKAGKNGQLSCNNILATGGTIGGWSINSGKIYAGDGSSVKTSVMQAPSSTITWVFAAGGSNHDSYSDCPFRVDKAGNLYATSATISGNITATGGTIGGCSISGGVLKIDAANVTSGTFSSARIPNLSADKITTGTLDASTVTVKNINASNITTGTINASKITITNINASNITTGKLSATYINGTGLKVTNGTFSGSISGELKDGITVGTDGHCTLNAYNSGHGNTGCTLSYSTTGYICIGQSSQGEEVWIYSGRYVTLGSTDKTSSGCYIIAKNLTLGNQNATDSTDTSSGRLFGNWTLNGSTLATTSDANLKNTISNIQDKYNNFFDLIRPVTFKYNQGTSDRLHTGFIAQEVLSALNNSDIESKDFGGFIAEKNDDQSFTYYLRYEEFIALNTWQIQKLKLRISELEAKISILEASGGTQ